VVYLKNKTKGQILEGLRQTKNLYNSRGFTVVEVGETMSSRQLGKAWQRCRSC
jgi:hypothetical protein